MITSDILKLNLSAIIELFSLDLNALGTPTILYFHGGVNELMNDVVWNGQTYVRYPIAASGFEWTGKGQFPIPKLSASNKNNVMSALNVLFRDLVGAKLTRRRTLLKYLDAVNFAAGNANADPTAEFPVDIFYVERKVLETLQSCEYELSSILDVEGKFLPARQVIQNLCSNTYKEMPCPYAGLPGIDAGGWDSHDNDLMMHSPIPGTGTVTVLAVAGLLPHTTYYYKYSFVNATGETIPAALGTNGTTSAGHEQIQLTVPVGITGTTSRKIYRLDGGTYKYLATVPDNSTTTYTDNTASVSGNPAAPVENTTFDRSKDVCGKRLSSCEVRYNQNFLGMRNMTLQSIPYAGFPGATRV